MGPLGFLVLGFLCGPSGGWTITAFTGLLDCAQALFLGQQLSCLYVLAGAPAGKCYADGRGADVIRHFRDSHNVVLPER
jgi:hypothetical protein